MVAHGDAVAWGLCDGLAGDPETGIGWRGALQAAADLSQNDPEILRIADEIHIVAPMLRGPGRVFAYVDATQATTTSVAALTLLRGMLLHLERTRDD